MKRPAFIKRGDAAGIVAPAGILRKPELDYAIQVLKGWGLRIVCGKHLYARHHFFAGNDEQRSQDLQEMLDDEQIKVIFCARGGYGTIRIIEKLNFAAFEHHPKWIVGYSDITVLHSFLSGRLGISSLHAAMPRNFEKAAKDGHSLNYLKSILSGELPRYTVPPHELNRAGRTTGTLTGGNLSILYNLQSTAIQPGIRNKVLFIEEVSEYLYHLDRMMMNLKLSGTLAGLKGLIVGGMTRMKDSAPGFGKKACEIIAEATGEFKYPVMFGFPAGHRYPNLPLIMGNEVELNVTGSDCNLNFLP